MFASTCLFFSSYGIIILFRFLLRFFFFQFTFLLCALFLLNIFRNLSSIAFDVLPYFLLLNFLSFIHSSHVITFKLLFIISSFFFSKFFLFIICKSNISKERKFHETSHIISEFSEIGNVECE